MSSPLRSARRRQHAAIRALDVAERLLLDARHELAMAGDELDATCTWVARSADLPSPADDTCAGAETCPFSAPGCWCPSWRPSC